MNHTNTFPMWGEGADGFRIVFLIIGILVIVSGFALSSVAEPGQLRILSTNPTPYGYTSEALSPLVFVIANNHDTERGVRFPRRIADL